MLYLDGRPVFLGIESEEKGAPFGVATLDALGTHTASEIPDVEHNDTTNLQGGAADEYYHLDAAQHTALVNGEDASAQHHHDSLYTPVAPRMHEISALSANGYAETIATSFTAMAYFLFDGTWTPTSFMIVASRGGTVGGDVTVRLRDQTNSQTICQTTYGALGSARIHYAVLR